MSKASPELVERRKKEIIDACETIYKAKGFYGVTIKEISTRTSFTRPSIYNYFETKDEILLALLVREYEKLNEDLQRVKEEASSFQKEQLAAAIAHTLEGREVLLRIQNMNLFEMEENSRVERLAEFKRAYWKNVEILMDIFQAYSPGAARKDCEACRLTFSVFLFGVYSFAFHTKKQLEAMEMAGVANQEATIYEMVYNCLVKILPEQLP